ncbi:MAG TPA: hypothetical protein VKP30_04785 [Polyangiaceae bacterium]|nr:hypothetical protein [Polyangiaceae bacterium]
MTTAQQIIAAIPANSHVRIADLRKRVNASRADFDAALTELLFAGRVALYREDNNAALTQADRDAAYMAGDCPRHIAYRLV